MNSIQDYNPDQHENEEKYWDLVKRIGKIEEKLDKMDKANEEDGSEMEWDPDAIEGMTEAWIFKQLTIIDKCLASIIDIGEIQLKANENVIEALKEIDKKLGEPMKQVGSCHPLLDERAARSIKGMGEKLFGNLATPPKANPTKGEPFGGLSLPNGPGWITGKHITSLDDIKETKDGYVFSDLAGPDDGLHTVGSNDPTKTKVDVSKLEKPLDPKHLMPTIVNPEGRNRRYHIDGDELEGLISAIVLHEYIPTAIRYDDNGVEIVLSDEHGNLARIIRYGRIYS